MDRRERFGLIGNSQLILDLDRRRLLRDGQAVAIGSRAFDIVAALASAGGAPVSRAALTDAAWPDTAVSENNLAVQITALRRALGREAIIYDRHEGYRLTLPVQTVSSAPTETRHNLKHDPALLVGREDDLGAVLSRLQAGRLLSIVGPGGVGKTRLALAAAGELLQDGLDAIWVVELAAARDPGQVPTLIAHAMGLQQSRSEILPAILDRIGSSRMLLVLDNAEHLLDGVAGTAEWLLTRAPRLNLLVTSREALRVPGEAVYRLGPLPCPPEGAITAEAALGYPAVQLLKARTGPGWTLTDANAAEISRLCRLVDGLPFGLELVAARLREQGLSLLANQLALRLDALAKADAVATRHDTLWGALDWSYELLTPAEQVLLRRLSVFSSGWTIEGAKSVCSAPPLDRDGILPLVGALTARSLVDPPGSRPHARHRLLETVRCYAADLQEASGEPDLRQVLAQWLIERHRVSRCELAGGPAESNWDALYLDDIADIRNLMTWAFGPNGAPVLGKELLLASRHVWWRGGWVSEYGRWVGIVLDDARAELTDVEKARLYLGPHNMSLGKQVDPALYDAALRTVRGNVDALDLSRMLIDVSWIRRNAGDLDGAEIDIQEARSLAAEAGGWRLELSAATTLALLYTERGMLAQARELLVSCLDAAEKTDLSFYTTSLRLAEFEFASGHRGRALDIARRNAASIQQISGKPQLSQAVHGNLASYLLAEGHLHEGMHHVRIAARIARDWQITYAHPWTFDRTALGAALAGHMEMAARLAGFAEALLKRTGARRLNTEAIIRNLLARHLSTLEAEEWSRLSDEGAGWDEVWAHAMLDRVFDKLAPGAERRDVHQAN